MKHGYVQTTSENGKLAKAVLERQAYLPVNTVSDLVITDVRVEQVKAGVIVAPTYLHLTLG
ncbi:hypothetical protein A3K79_05440 [Candidatus Bathyarchaeota archaeon RBG_13_46_16b]|nr:MAG: hypothetical protein A3K79_05440 [Candidatus Bathyarchaeota archaeon RBG_13_46_16b]